MEKRDVALTLGYEVATGVQSAIGEAVSVMKEAYQIKRLCRLDEMIDKVITEQTKQDRASELARLKAEMSDIDWKIKRLED